MNWNTPTEEQFRACMSETAKHRHLTAPYCSGNGVDIGSGGDPVVPWAIQVELSPESYGVYNSGHETRGLVQWRGDNAFLDLPLKDGTLDFVFSSHLIEDFVDWMPILKEWIRVLKRGGHLVICLPDKARWNESLRRGQPPNCAHKHESFPGELRAYMGILGGMDVIQDALTDSFYNERTIDYNIMFVAKKL